MSNINTNKIISVLYLIAVLIIFIPISIVLITDIPFSSLFSKVFISTSILLVVIGKVLRIIKKDKKDKSIAVDIGTIIGILMAWISTLLD